MSDPYANNGKISQARWTVVALAIAAFLYAFLINRHMGHSAAMFLGIPTLLAILLALTLRARTVTGGIVLGITLTLLIIAPMAREGYLCILVASPLFYLVGIIIGLIVDNVQRSRTTTLRCVAIVLLPMCLEGVWPELSFSRPQTIEVIRVVDASPGQVEAELSLSPKLQTSLPTLLRIGFPVPLEAHGEGLSLGDQRTIHFSGAEGDPPGDLVMQVAARRPGYVRFETVRDGSKLLQWVKWTRSEVQWKVVDTTRTAVTWRVSFDRQLDPAWYFVPIERAAVHQVAKYLIEANATPSGTGK